MRATKKCPKCDCEYIGLFTAVLEVELSNAAAARGDIPTSVYSCSDCGYSETFFAKPFPTWNRTPEEWGVEFSWLRTPPNPKGPFR